MIYYGRLNKKTESANPRYVFADFDFDKIQNILIGDDINRHLKDYDRAVLLCVTLGNETDTLIRKLQITDMSAALETDFMMNEFLEQCIDEVEIIIKEKLNITKMSTRFSPGYGDFPLEVQPEFIRLTDAAKKIGLTLSDTLMMTPLKSVTAIIGYDL